MPNDAMTNHQPLNEGNASWSLELGHSLDIGHWSLVITWCVSPKCVHASAHQFSLYGSGPASRWTVATASSILDTASWRHVSNILSVAQFFCRRKSSATFKQSRPSGDALSLGST